MRIHKFGGASIRNPDQIKNLPIILNDTGTEKIFLVVSAIGKTTNLLEKIVYNYFNNKQELESSINELICFHKKILKELFKSKNHQIFNAVKTIFDDSKDFLKINKSPNYSFVYDQLVPVGELVATKIICAYLNDNGIKCNWIDSRTLIKTDSSYRDANVIWDITKKNIDKNINQDILNVSQGFISSNKNNFSTTLGREGSDYSAAIYAFCLNASSVTIWKDVPGVLNADPRVFKSTTLLENLSYTEAIELAFYGASVIHPRTLQPLQRKEIPLYVKSFLNPKGNGTAISRGVKIKPKVPCFIVKKNLNFLKLSSLDFSFIVEDNISDIFQILHENKMKVDLMQNSAISFSLCIEDKYDRLKELLSILKATFKVECIAGVNLFTIRHFDKNSEKLILKNNELVLEQRSNHVLRLVVK